MTSIAAQVCDPATIALEGLCLIEASAGTGKTFTITALALRMIVEREVSVDALLVVTFTKAATAELKGRIYERLLQARDLLEHGEAADPLLAQLHEQWLQCPGQDQARARIHAALADFDRASVFTIHGWCQRLLQDHSFARGDVSAIELRSDHREWLQGFAQDFWSRRLYDLPAQLVAAIYQSAQRCGPDALMEVATLALSDPDLEVRGAFDWESATARFNRRLETWARLKGQIQQHWCHDAPAIRAYFQEIWPKLNQATHRASSYQKRIDAIFGWVEQPFESPPSVLLKKALDMLSDQGLRRKKSLKAKQTLDAHPALVALDPCAEAIEELDQARQELSLAFVRDFVFELRARVGDPAKGPSDCTFDELLVRVRDLLRDPAVGPSVILQTRSTYAAALIDEFQDTDPAQYEIVSTFWGREHGALFLVGDPKQAIYRFRGADIHAYLEARRQADSARFMLTHNYRSQRGVIEAVNAVFSGIDAPFGLTGLDFVPVKVGRDVDQVQLGEAPAAALAFWRGEKLRGEAQSWEIQALCQRVRAFLEQGRWSQGAPVQASDMAVLCNSNHQARSIRERFDELNIPCVLRSGLNVWHSQQGQEMALLLRAIAYPGQRHRLKAALVTQALGLNLNEVWDLGDDDAAWERWAFRFFAWRKLWTERGVLAMWRNLRDQVALGPRLAGQRGGLRALTNWEHLADLVYFLEREHRCGPSRLCVLVDQARSNQASPEEIEELRACDERPSVQILTIHKSKGLEFPIVFCPYLWKAKADHQPFAFVHHEEGARALMLNGPSAEEAVEHYAKESHGEARRLLYVALTRAKSHCEIFWVKSKTNRSALGTLLQQHDPQGEDPLGGMQFLASEHPASIACGDLSIEEQSGSMSLHREAPVDLSNQAPHPPQTWQRFFGPKVSSYSALARGLRQESASSDPLRPGQDESQAAEEFFAPDEPETLRFAMLEPGAQSGIFLHELFQTALDPAVDPEQRLQLLSECTARYGQDDPELVAQVFELLEMPLPLGQASVRLGALDRSQRGVEIEFLFRCGAFGGSRAIGGVMDPVPFELLQFAKILMEQSEDARLVDYGRSLTQRGTARLQGFLNGFIDLVFEHQGRYLVVDYKSNILDGRLANFTPGELWSYAAEKDYILQTLIYGVAMFRRLVQHQQDPLSHLGSGYLLFLRGLNAQGSGILEVPLELNVISALSDAMQQGFFAEAKPGALA